MLPEILVRPLRPGARADAPTDLDVLVRVVPPRPEVHVLRPPINLGLVLDRSGSMSTGKKLEHARQAAIFAVEQLLPGDRLSVTVFDDQVQTIVPNAPLTDKAGAIEALRGIHTGGSTALHAAWAEGADQVGRNLVAGGLNRVLLLSDGQANQGLTDPQAIAAEVQGRNARGVSTTTLGVGDDYNEDLMEQMARAGDGNYYFVETPAQLADLFQTELQGLMATVGRKVSLGLEPEGGAEVVDVLNDLDRAATGRLMLPNLVVGMPIDVVARLRIPPWHGPADVLGVRLAWDEPRGTARHASRTSLALHAFPSSEWEALPVDAEVRERVGLLESARLRRQAARAMEAGDRDGTREFLCRSHEVINALPPSAATAEGIGEVGELLAHLDSHEYDRMTKKSKFQSFRASRSRPANPPGGKPPEA